jgi:hypothetical protein
MLENSAKRWGRFFLMFAGVCAGVFVGFLVLAFAASAAPQAPGVEVGPNHAGEAEAGQSVTYQHTLTNTGTTTDTFLVEVFSTQDWPVALSDGDGPSSTLSLQVAGGMTASFHVSLTVPPDVAGVTEVTIVTVTSQSDPAAQDAALDTTTVPARIYMPLMPKGWPPIPSVPVLDPIDNADGNGLYTVSWSKAEAADTYDLEEDVNPDFTSPVLVHSGAELSWSVLAPGKPAGTYYYRVRGKNMWGYGPYSNVEAVTVERFRADEYALPAGQCTTLRWEFNNIRSLHISFGRGYDKEGVPGHGTRVVCPSVDTTYEALVVRSDGGKETHKVTIDVSGSDCGDPVIWAFYSNNYNVRPGEQFGIAWEVDCAKTVHLIIGGGAEEPVTGKGSKEVRIYSTTLFTLKVQKSDGSFVYRTFTVYLSS